MSDNLLRVADSERDADMLYATRLFVPAPFIYLHSRSRPLLVRSGLAIDRARQQAPHCRVVSLRDHQKKLRRNGVKSTGKLKAGPGVTVAPGLYDPGIGGGRLEGVVLVTTNCARNLTPFEKALEI